MDRRSPYIGASGRHAPSHPAFKRLRHVIARVSITGLCEVCESAEAVDSCERCGALVCRAHLDEELGYCADCARRMRRDREGEGKGEGEGEETFRF